MKKCKITVIKNVWNADLAKEYANPTLGPCEMHREGEVFYSNGWKKPTGLCDNAWKSMMEYVMTLSHGGKNFYDGWMKDEHTAIIGDTFQRKSLKKLNKWLNSAVYNVTLQIRSPHKLKTQPKYAENLV